MRRTSSLVVVLSCSWVVLACGDDIEGPQVGSENISTNPDGTGGTDGTGTQSAAQPQSSDGVPNSSLPGAANPPGGPASAVNTSGGPTTTQTPTGPGPANSPPGMTPGGPPSPPATGIDNPAPNPVPTPTFGGGGSPPVVDVPIGTPVGGSANGGNGPVAAGGDPGFPFPTGGTSTSEGGSAGDPSTGGDDTGGGLVELDCNAAMPTSGAQQHSGNGTGGEDNLGWEIWSNTGNGELTTYDVPAFSAIWNEAGGYLGRLGFEWGGFGQTAGTYESHGTITAQYVANKSGTAGQYSYVGMYGWSTDPCVEWYIVEDSFNNMPINPGGTTNEGEVDIDDGTYIMYTRPTTGTGGSRCSGVTNWIQYYSVRKTARQCGTISLTQHFDAWKSLNMNLGALLEAKILVEVGGGTGRVNLPIANVTVTQ